MCVFSRHPTLCDWGMGKEMAKEIVVPYLVIILCITPAKQTKEENGELLFGNFT